MVSSDQVDQAAESLLEPAKQELAAKQKKLARRKAIRTNFHKAILPAGVAAAVAIALGDDIGNPIIAIFFCSVVGAAAGEMLRKDA